MAQSTFDRDECLSRNKQRVADSGYDERRGPEGIDPAFPTWLATSQNDGRDNELQQRSNFLVGVAKKRHNQANETC